MAGAGLRDGELFGMGNPLLDIQANVDKQFLDKWGLKEDDAILCGDRHIAMFRELVELKDVKYLAGGSTQNSMRVAQWVLGRPNVITFMGCIGQDNYGEVLQNKMKEAGVRPVYQLHPTEKTGTCGVCIFGNNRSLCAHLAAANNFTVSHLQTSEHRALMEEALVFYVAGFFLTVCPPAIMEVARHACQNKKTFSMNLSAPFLTHAFKDPMMEAMPFVDILFGNGTEATDFAAEHNFQTESVKEIALKISQLPKEDNGRSRMVVLTHGAKPVVVARDGTVEEFPVPPMDPSLIVDTNGAGDAFVGGFLAQYMRNQPLSECVRCGIFTASVIIQNIGCTFPQTCDFQ